MCIPSCSLGSSSCVSFVNLDQCTSWYIQDWGTHTVSGEIRRGGEQGEGGEGGGGGGGRGDRMRSKGDNREEGV